MAVISLFTVGVPLSWAQVTFDSPRNFQSADGVLSMVSADFNKDGLPDIATSNRREDTASVHLNQGAAVFANPWDRYPVGPFPPLLAGEQAKAIPLAIASGDFNNDGFPDLAVSNSGADTVSILMNRGLLDPGKFLSAGNFTVRTDGATILPGDLNTVPLLEPGALAVADFNNDGRLDLALTNLRGRNISVLLGNGDGTFGFPAQFFVGDQPISIAAGDWNHDGAIDLAVSNHGPEIVPIVEGAQIFVQRYTVSVLMNNNNGTGSFAPEVRHQVGFNPLQVVAADLNNDTWLDLITANHAVAGAPAPIPSWVSVLMNNAAGAFNPEIQVATDQAPASVAAADLNNDGRLDIVTVHDYTPGTFAITTQNADGSFAPFATYSCGALNAPNYVNAADYDNDGDVDLLASSQATNKFALLLNQAVPNPLPPAPPGDPLPPPSPTDSPDLTVAIAKIKVQFSPKNNVTLLEFEAVISNIGNVNVAGGLTDVRAYLNGAMISNWFLSSGVQPGFPVKVKFKTTLIGSALGQTLKIIVDQDNFVIETNENNNSTSIILN